jgi:hypothetical protein
VSAWQEDRDYEITLTVNSVTNTPDLECCNVGLCFYMDTFLLTYKVIGLNKLDVILLDKNGIKCCFMQISSSFNKKSLRKEIQKRKEEREL